MTHPTLAHLSNYRDGLLAVVTPLSEESLDRRLSGWTIRQILTHLIATEAEHCQVIRAFADGQFDPLPPVRSLDEHNAQLLAKRGKSTRDRLLAALTRQRAATITLFESLTEEQLDRGGTHHTLGDVSVHNIFRVIGLHERHHVEEIKCVLQLQAQQVATSRRA